MSSDYWTSPIGIERRIDMLCESFTYQAVNDTLQSYGVKNVVWGYEWVTGLSMTGPCAFCLSMEGNTYRLGQPLPDIPVHSGCVCQLRLIS